MGGRPRPDKGGDPNLFRINIKGFKVYKSFYLLIWLFGEGEESIEDKELILDFKELI
ncbi:MAG: hypothetical protein QW052_06175 [Candidatus Nitrosocaldaceae archaeon]